MTDNKFLGGLAAFGTALMIPDATDALFPGAADTVKYAKRIDGKRLKEIFDGIFDGGSPFTRAVTPEGVEVPNTFFMSKSDDATGGLRDFSKVTSPEYKNIIISGMERMGMKNGVFDIDLYNQNVIFIHLVFLLHYHETQLISHHQNLLQELIEKSRLPNTNLDVLYLCIRHSYLKHL